MRVAPVAITAYTSAELTSTWAAAQAEVTHGHPTAIGLRGSPPSPGAAIAGTASAAVPAAIPGALVERLEHHDQLIALADDLLEVAIRAQVRSA